MKNLFIPYRESLLLKELGFNDSCLAYYRLSFDDEKDNFKTELAFFKEKYNNNRLNLHPSAGKEAICTAPLFHQVIEWFISTKQLTYNLYPVLNTSTKEIWYDWVIFFLDEPNWDESNDSVISIRSFKNIMSCNNQYDNNDYFKTREEAELNVINTMIKIVKRKLI